MLLDSFSLETETETEAEARARTSPGGEMGSLAASGGGRGVQEAEWVRGAPSGRNPRCDVGNSGALLPEALRIPSSPSRPPRASPRPSPSQTSSAAPTLSHRAKRIPGPHGASHRPVSLFVSSPGLLLWSSARSSPSNHRSHAWVGLTCARRRHVCHPKVATSLPSAPTSS